MSQLLVINHLEPSISHDTISPNHATPSWSDRRAISKVIFAGTALWALAGFTLWARDIFTRGGGSSLPLQPHRITQCWYRGLCYRPSPLGGRGWPWSPPSFIYIIIYVYIYTHTVSIEREGRTGRKSRLPWLAISSTRLLARGIFLKRLSPN